MRNILPIHPGHFVKKTVLIPRKLKVTQVAKMLGLSRPSVSNFLNGKVSATQNMAARLEEAFEIPASTILQMQVEYDAYFNEKSRLTQDVRTYVPPFLKIVANDLEDWFSSVISARTQLAVLLRILVNSTGRDMQKVDFPGNDDAERSGSDGVIESLVGTPWIPLGKSVWEFGVTLDINGKAKSDFEKSVKAITENERRQTTFVFVTPRRWNSKNTWVSKMKAINHWKDVRAYDASDLEQWMEQSIAAQTWFANQTNRPSNGVRTLDCCWKDWAEVTEPHLTPALFGATINRWKLTVETFLNSESPNPLSVTADSVGEALAFISQIFSISEFSKYKDRVLVFDKPDVLPTLAQGKFGFIAVSHTREVGKELAVYQKSLKSIVIYPRNAVNFDPNIELKPLEPMDFRESLKGMIDSQDEIERLAEESGYSLTILRRRLSTNYAIRTPEWADQSEIAMSLIPFVFLGAWNTNNAQERELVSELSQHSIDNVEKFVLQTLQLEDSPIWSINSYRGIVSKLDAFYAISKFISEADLERFFTIAFDVLKEDDPSLDLPNAERWMASIHGKQRVFSSTLRKNIADSLALLAVHGKKLFNERIGMNVEARVAQLIRKLLEPLTARKLESNNFELPFYAEAAPGCFLNLLEEDLLLPNPEVIGLLRPVQTGPFASCPRTGLLWALEGLAWNPTTFPRVVRILGQLAEINIDDNWGNKPIESLLSIFRVWRPQTSVDSDKRSQALHLLMKEHPKVGWEVCITQLNHFKNSVAEHGAKPKWRREEIALMEPTVNATTIRTSINDILETVLTQPVYSREMVCDLISTLRFCDSKIQNRIWKIIDRWSLSDVDEESKANVREHIRRNIILRPRKKISEEERSLIKKAKLVVTKMTPKNKLYQYEWLFRQSWVEESADELDDVDTNYEERRRRINTLRANALSDIFQELGLEGLISCAKMGKTQYEIGGLLSSEIFAKNSDSDNSSITEFVRLCMAMEDRSIGNNVLIGLVWRLTDDRRRVIFENLFSQISEEEILRLLLLFPYEQSTWQFIDRMPEKVSSSYWNAVEPRHIFNSSEANNESVRRLMKVGRPWIAFSSVEYQLETISPELLVDLLSAMRSKSGENLDKCHCDGDSIRKAFVLVDRNSKTSLEQKAFLEYTFLPFLTKLYSDGPQQIPNLELYLERHPELFSHAVDLIYKRDDGKDDMPEFDEKRKRELAEMSDQFLTVIERIPGRDAATEDDRTKTLEEWVSAVRDQCAKHNRSGIADYCLGQFLSRCPEGSDGVWPNETVREVIERLHSQKMCSGVEVAKYNSRGAHFIDGTGAQERGLAEKYRLWADKLQFTHPFVSENILMRLVEMYEWEANSRRTETQIERRLMK